MMMIKGPRHPAKAWRVMNKMDRVHDSGRKERDFILAPNEEQREWVDTDDEEALLARMHTWDGLKGISSQTAACAKGEGCLAIVFQGVKLCLRIASQGGLPQSSGAGNCLGISSAAN